MVLYLHNFIIILSKTIPFSVTTATEDIYTYSS